MNSVFDDELIEGEEILWTGQPTAWVMLSPVDWLLIPLTIALGSQAINLAVYIILRFVMSGGREVSALTMIGYVPFALIGTYVIVGRFIFKYWRKKHTHYAVTNTRIMVMIALDRRYLTSEWLTDIPEMHKRVGPNGIGSIVFARSPFIAAWCGNTGMNCTIGFDKREFMAFHDIHNANRVYLLIDNLRNSS